MTDVCDFGNSYLFLTGKSNPDDRREVGSVVDYSEVRRLPVTNTLYSAGQL